MPRDEGDNDANGLEGGGQGHIGHVQAPAPQPLALTPYALYMKLEGFQLVARNPGHGPESPWEKQLYVVEPDNDSVADHAWATARFAIRNVAEHAELFGLLLPQQLARTHRDRAVQLQKRYERVARDIDVRGPPALHDVDDFLGRMRDELAPIIEFKKACQELQAEGALRSLAWPLLFDHAYREALHWDDRLARLEAGDAGLDPRRTRNFWNRILAEHGDYMEHLDPVGRRLVHAVLRPRQVTAPPQASVPPNEGQTVLQLARDSLSQLTTTVREVEAARMQSVLAPMLVEHWRSESVWAVDELQRAHGA